MSEKKAFEKIKSVVEKRKIIEQVIENKIILNCKSDSDAFFNWAPKFCIEGANQQKVATWKIGGALVGDTAEDLPPKGSTEMVTLFQLEQDRYFFHSEFTLDQGVWWTGLDFDLFRLERRKSLRVEVPNSAPVYLNVISIQGKNCFYEAKVVDLSSGGLKLHFVGKEPLVRANDLMKCVIHPAVGKTFDFEILVKHISSMVREREMIPLYGVEFINPSQASSRRVTSLVLELQKKQVLGFSFYKD